MNPLLQYCGSQSKTLARWARFGPYYAMFPVQFAFDVISTYSRPGEKVLDPFCGRGTSIFAAGAMDRIGTGIDINPLGWIFSQAKLNPACEERVLQRLREIYGIREEYTREIQEYGEFFRICYCDEVLKFLLAARELLRWRQSRVDRTLMAFILDCLHADIGQGLSNQMRRTKAYNIQYSINWWKRKGFLTPPEVNPYKALREKIQWRYRHGLPKMSKSKVIFGDSRETVETLEEGYSLLFTSPPYCGVTDYFEDQWLRIWLLGGPPAPRYVDNFKNKEKYRKLLDDVFGKSAKLMKKDATIYVRTDSRKFTLETTKEVLSTHFPHHNMSVQESPIGGNVTTQTVLCGNRSKSPGETDIILRP